MIKLTTLCLESFKYGNDPKFEKLAEAQRGAPEDAMLQIQRAQICQIYGFLCEHIGDLTNRMCQIGLLAWSYGAVDEKVHKTLHTLVHSYGFEKEMNEQIEATFEYYQEKGSNKYASVDDARETLRQLGHKYADAHRSLPVFNHITKVAQHAAISLGEWKFDTTRAMLQQIKAVLGKGQTVWAKAVTEGTDEYDKIQ